MLGFFRNQKFLKEEDEEWHLETWKFLLDKFGGIARLEASPLVTASREFFPPTDATGHERAVHIFTSIKTLAGMNDWPCTLVAQPERIRTQVSDFVFLRIVDKDLPLGTFSVQNGEVTITYDPASLNQPAVLVSTLAHELAHYLLAGTRSEVPGGEDMHEFATDLTTVFLGFGLFGANRAFEFSQHGDALGQGWKYSTAGYLRERDWVFAIAVFLALRGEQAAMVKKLLKPHLYADLCTAEKYLTKNPDLLRGLRS